MPARALLLVTTSFPQEGDGSEAAGSFVADLAAELAGHLPVRVVAPGRTGRCESLSPGLTVYRFAAPAQPLSTLRAYDPRQWAQIARVLRAGQRAVLEAAADGAVCHTLALWALPSGYWARRLLRQRGVAYSVWMLGSDVWTLGRLPLIRSILAGVMRQAAVRFADGLKLAQDSRRIAGRPVEFLPSTRTISATRQRPLASRGPYRLIFLGRWHPNKGIDLLLDALAGLGTDDWAQIEAVELFGGGPMDALVRRGAAALQARGLPVHVGGYLDKAAAEAAILRADYLIIPSRIESIPLVFSDAVKLACPVVCTPVGDLRDLVEGGAVGFCAERIDAAAIAAALRRAIGTAPVQFSAALDAMARRFSLGDEIVPRILAATQAAP